MEKIDSKSIASLALNSFIGGSQVKSNTDDNFQNYLQKADNVEFNKKEANDFEKVDNKIKKESTKAEKKDDIYSKEKIKTSDKQDKNINKSDDANEKTAESVAKSDEKTTDNSAENTTENEGSVDEVVETEATDKTAEVSDKKAEILEEEAKLIEEIAKITNLSVEEVSNALEQIGISSLQLADKQTLIEFMQEVFDVQTPVELLNVDNAKEMIENITKTVQDTVSNLEMDIEPEMLNEIIEKAIVDKTDEKVEGKFDKIIEPKDELVESEQPIENDVAYVPKVQTPSFEMFSNNDGFMNGNQKFVNQNEVQNINVGGVVMDNISKAFNEVMTRAESTKNVDTAEIIRQIIDKIKIEGTESQINEFKITLKPDYLGELSLKITTENGIITAQFTAESQKVKEIIEANFEQLKTALAEQGLEVGQLEVNVGNSNENPSGNMSYTQGAKASSDIVEDIVVDETNYIDEADAVEANVSYMA